MLEWMLVILPFYAIICAIIDFSMALFIRNSLNLAVREGVRYAVTQQVGYGGAACQDASIKSVVQANAMGVLNGSTGLSHIQINYYDQNLGDVTAAANSNAGGNIVRISVNGVNWLWMMSGMWENVNALRSSSVQHYSGLTMGAASSDIMEPPTSGVLPCR